MCVCAQIGSLSRAACNDKLPEGGRIDVCKYAGRPCHRTVDACKICNAIRHDNVADALARQGEGLAVGVADDRVLVDERNTRDGQTVIHDFAIGLVCDDKNRMPELRFLFA